MIEGTKRDFDCILDAHADSYHAARIPSPRRGPDTRNRYPRLANSGRCVSRGRWRRPKCRISQQSQLETVRVGWLGYRFGYKISRAGRYHPAVDTVALRHLSLADADAYYSLVDRNRVHLTRHSDYSFAVDATPELGLLRSSIVDRAGLPGEAHDSPASGICIRGFPLPGRSDHGGGALVPAVRPVVPRRRGAAGRAWCRGRPCHRLPMGAAIHAAVRRCGPLHTA